LHNQFFGPVIRLLGKCFEEEVTVQKNVRFFEQCDQLWWQSYWKNALADSAHRHPGIAHTLFRHFGSGESVFNPSDMATDALKGPIQCRQWATHGLV
jgi:hypothetical protein